MDEYLLVGAEKLAAEAIQAGIEKKKNAEPRKARLSGSMAPASAEKTSTRGASLLGTIAAWTARPA